MIDKAKRKRRAAREATGGRGGRGGRDERRDGRGRELQKRGKCKRNTLDMKTSAWK